MSKSLLILFFSFLFVSCSAKKNQDAEHSLFLRQKAELKESTITWAYDFSQEKKTNEKKKLPVSDKYTSEPLALLLTQQTAGSYPVLKGFGSLDISFYSKSQLSTIEGFLNNFFSDKNADSFFEKGFLFSYTLFKFNFERNDKKVKDLNKYVIGKPFVRESECQSPVRLFFKDGKYSDIVVYLVKTSSDWKINQIDFIGNV